MTTIKKYLFPANKERESSMAAEQQVVDCDGLVEVEGSD
jgi:hypothetical protein